MTENERVAARLLIVGFLGDVVSQAARGLIDAGVSGCILFARNVPEPAAVRSLTGGLKAVRMTPLLSCIDQEGGRVARLRGPFTAVPSAREIGATDNLAIVPAAGRVLGAEMRWAGFDVNFAPVVDVDSNPANPVIGSRSYGASAEVVSRMAAAMIPAMQGAGVAACAKHFPGHGDTATDSHHALPRLPHSLERLNAVELPPFQAAVDAGVASVMTAHVIFEAVDPAYPATMSRAALGDIVRGQMNFDGVIFSDDLEMKAVADHYALEEQLLRGHEAGVDLFLICHTEAVQWKAIEILAGAIGRGTISPKRLQDSLRRIDVLTGRYCGGPGSSVLAELQEGLSAERAMLARVGVGATELDPTKYK